MTGRSLHFSATELKREEKSAETRAIVDCVTIAVAAAAAAATDDVVQCIEIETPEQRIVHKVRR